MIPVLRPEHSHTQRSGIRIPYEGEVGPLISVEGIDAISADEPEVGSNGNGKSKDCRSAA